MSEIFNSKKDSKNNPTNDLIHEELVHKDSWAKLSQFTNARIGLGRAGTSIPTAELLRFQLSHAQAIDAVHVPLNIDDLSKQFSNTPELVPYLPAQILHSKVKNRIEYLQRPDYGRKLNDNSIDQLKKYRKKEPYDLVFVVADGLSSYAIANHTVKFLALLISQLKNETNKMWDIAPICIVQQGRVAIGDDVCEAINAKEVILLIGERPGLSSPDSMGLYLTWKAKRGYDDSLRNCISNIRPDGLNYSMAVHKCLYLLKESFTNQLSGVDLKDRSDDTTLEHSSIQKFCLTY